ncbi:MAG: hypothetical protein KF866_12395 [Phycisphaeraceae bacterium]|nr:hypothetical protein [Phycisphaeraceae bacterium]MCW5754056.1 hypothetical protein [Phycisphaeraceae bacterium]
MHLMTKLLVALAAVLCVALSTLTMAYAVNADRIVKEWRSERAAREAAEEMMKGLQQERAGQTQVLELRIQSLRGEMGGMAVSLNDAQRRANVAETDRATAHRELASARNESTTAINLATGLKAITERQFADLTEMRKSDLRMREVVRQLTDRLNDSESRALVLTGTVRSLRETIADLQSRIDGRPGVATASTGARPADTGDGVAAINFFAGRVDEVAREAATGTTLVRVNVGTNDSVQPDTILYVQRGPVWIANLRVIQTDLNFSVAQVTSLASGQTIQAGDVVQSRLISQ